MSPFVRWHVVSQSRTKRVVGLGLGLGVCEEMAYRGCPLGHYDAPPSLARRFLAADWPPAHRPGSSALA